MFLLAQVLGFIAMSTNIIAVQLKTKKQILFTIVVGNILFVISYFLLGAYAGALISGINAIEVIINTKLEEKGKPIPKALIGLYFVVAVTIGVFAFNSFMDLLPVLAAILFIFTLIQSKEKNIRLLLLGNNISWLIYDLLAKAYAAGVSDLFVITSTLIAIYRYDIRKTPEKHVS